MMQLYDVCDMAFQNRPEFHVVVCSLNGVTLGSAILRSGLQSEALQQLLGGASILLARTLVTFTSTINPSQATMEKHKVTFQGSHIITS